MDRNQYAVGKLAYLRPRSRLLLKGTLFIKGYQSSREETTFITTLLYVYIYSV